MARCRSTSARAFRTKTRWPIRSRFAKVKDYEDWIARLRAFPAYMDQTIELMRRGIAEKIVQPKIVMRRVPDQIQRQIVEKPEESLYYKPLKKFPDDIAPAEQERLQGGGGRGDQGRRDSRLSQVPRVLHRRVSAGLLRPGRGLAIAAGRGVLCPPLPRLHDDQAHAGRDPRNRPERSRPHPQPKWRRFRRRWGSRARSSSSSKACGPTSGTTTRRPKS